MALCYNICNALNDFIIMEKNSLRGASLRHDDISYYIDKDHIKFPILVSFYAYFTSNIVESKKLHVDIINIHEAKSLYYKIKHPSLSAYKHLNQYNILRTNDDVDSFIRSIRDGNKLYTNSFNLTVESYSLSLKEYLIKYQVVISKYIHVYRKVLGSDDLIPHPEILILPAKAIQDLVNIYKRRGAAKNNADFTNFFQFPMGPYRHTLS